MTPARRAPSPTSARQDPELIAAVRYPWPATAAAPTREPADAVSGQR